MGSQSLAGRRIQKIFAAMDVDYLARAIAQIRRRTEAEFERGLSESEVRAIEAVGHFRFPPDLRAFLEFALPVSDRFPNWRRASAADIREWLEWPLRA